MGHGDQEASGIGAALVQGRESGSGFLGRILLLGGVGGFRNAWAIFVFEHFIPRRDNLNMSTNPYAPPQAHVSDAPHVGTAPPMWNPNAAANWSLLLSPAFGAYLHMLNWRALGESGKAAAARVWFAIGLVLPVVYAVTGLGIVALLYLLLWYFVSARGQAKYVKSRFGDSYPRRSWGKPLMIGLVLAVGYGVVATLIADLLGAGPPR